MSDPVTQPTGSYASELAGPPKPSKLWLWVGRVITVVPGLMILTGGVSDVMKPEVVVKGLAEAGYREEILVPLGLVTIAVSLLLLIPQTMVLGGLFMLCYLGGAVAIHLRAAQYGQMFVPVAFGVLIWTGLLLREPRLRTLLPTRQSRV